MLVFKVFTSVEGRQLARRLFVGDFILLPSIEGFVYAITAINKEADEVSVRPVGTLYDGYMRELPTSGCKFKFSGSTLVRPVIINAVLPSF